MPFAIAAQSLFCPNFVEYRGCVVVVKNGDDEGNLGDQKENADAVLVALAVEHGCEIVTLDRDFARFESIRHRRPELSDGS